VKLIAGLGNPGARYRGTRHNVGFAVLDELARRHAGGEFTSAPSNAVYARARSLGDGTLLVKPLTFMNLSGHAVGELLRYFKIELADLLVVTDDVNLPLGRLRARARGTAGGHNGLKSLIGELGTVDIARLRVGVGRGDGRRDLADHVLDRFDAEEQGVVAEAIQRAADAAEMFAVEGIDRTMNQFNRSEESDTRSEENDHD
jgi:PTH1 family peptidyl-tRNA hydrolase